MFKHAARIAVLRFLSLFLIAILAAMPSMAEESKAGGGDCVDPPDDMIAWWPFDECDDPSECPDPIDPSVDPAEEVAGTNDGTYIGNVGLVGGRVGGAISVGSGYVEVPHDPSLNFGSADFSIEFWASGNGVWFSTYDWPTQTGIEIVNEVFGNFMRVQINDLPNEIHCGDYPSSGWVHVGLTVNRDSGGGGQTTVKCFEDGVEVHSEDVILIGSLDNGQPIRIGDGAVGEIDELSLYSNDIPASDMAAIHGAGSSGKCKEGGYAPWDKPFCFQDNDTDVSLAVCNYGTTTHTYSVEDIEPLPTSFHAQCTVDGPTGFQVLTPGPITVTPGTCGEIVLRVDRPNYTADGQGSCYEVTFRNEETGNLMKHEASVWSSDEQCVTVVNPPRPLLELEPAQVSRVLFNVRDTGRGTSTPVEIRVVRSDMTEGGIPISLNGRKAGRPVRSYLEIPRGGSVQLPISITATDFEPFTTYDVLVVVPNDGREAVLQSTGMRILPGKSGTAIDDPRKIAPGQSREGTRE